MIAQGTVLMATVQTVCEHDALGKPVPKKILPLTDHAAVVAVRKHRESDLSALPVASPL